jgi:hypothetical protein
MIGILTLGGVFLGQGNNLRSRCVTQGGEPALRQSQVAIVGIRYADQNQNFFSVRGHQ